MSLTLIDAVSLTSGVGGSTIVATDATITGDGTLGDPLSILTTSSSFAHFSQEGNMAETVLVSQNVFENINCLLTGQLLSNFTVLNNTITYIGVSPINVEIAVSISVKPSGNKKDSFFVKAFKNGSIALNGRSQCQIKVQETTSNLIIPSPFFTVASLVQNDTIDLKIANGINGTNVIANELSGIIKTI